MSDISERPVSGRQRGSRADGEETRTRIVETAGRLFAECGYANTTSKSVCEHANVNMAAINYHFGSRDGLYLAVLHEVHRHMMGLEYLNSLIGSDLPPEEKLAQFLQQFVHYTLDEESWQTRLWAMEMLEQSPLFATVIENEAAPKFSIVSHILSEVTGLPVSDPAIVRSVLSIIAPCLLLLIINRHVRRVPSPFLTVFEQSEEDLVEHLKTFSLAGLKAIAARRS